MGVDAPPAYTNTPTRIGILALIGRWVTGTDPIVPLHDWYQPALPNGHPEYDVTLIGEPGECMVAGTKAAYFEYTAMLTQSTGAAVIPQSPAGVRGYMIVFLHHNNGFGLRIEGTGGIDPRAGDAVRQILGSWRWTS
ncbi:MAG TPA: hypothetical protein VJT78_11935 [Candidatus Dormibacteraeota bacterium]|nr:hypothetical protein [Candidatus Dormibacteraeota bacterium]